MIVSRGNAKKLGIPAYGVAVWLVLLGSTAQRQEPRPRGVEDVGSTSTWAARSRWTCISATRTAAT